MKKYRPKHILRAVQFIDKNTPCEFVTIDPVFGEAAVPTPAGFVYIYPKEYVLQLEDGSLYVVSEVYFNKHYEEV